VRHISHGVRLLKMLLARHGSITAVATETDLSVPTRHLHHAIQIVLIAGIIVSAASLTLRLWAKYHACKELYIEDCTFLIHTLPCRRYHRDMC
jgi:hypothetical protein